MVILMSEFSKIAAAVAVVVGNLIGLEAEGKSTEVYFESVTFPSLLYINIGFEVEASLT